MESYEKELAIHRIASGYVKYKINNDLSIFIYHPDADTRYDAQEIYNEIYQMARECGTPTNEELMEVFKSRGMWSEDKDKLIDEILPEKIENLKVDIYKANLETDRREALRQELRKAEGSLIKLLNAKHNYNFLTCAGIAGLSKSEYIVQHSTKYKDGKMYEWKEVNLQTVIAYVNKVSIDESDFREIARTDPWRGIWSSSKRNGQVFSRYGVDLTDEQRKLIAYSGFYDQLAEHPECPHDSILNDDDMLDGWLIIQKREREKDQNQKSIETKITNPKIANSQEIYIVAKNVDELRKINELNSAHSKAVKISRINKSQILGEAVDTDFADVQREIIMKKHEIASQQRK